MADPRHVARPEVRILHSQMPSSIKLYDGPLLSHHDVLLQRMIGAGRMGKVYQAWQHSCESCGRREIPPQVVSRSTLGRRALHRRGENHRQAASPQHRRNPRTGSHTRRLVFHRHGPRRRSQPGSGRPNKTHLRGRRPSVGPSRLAMPSNMRTRGGSSIVISNRPTLCSMQDGSIRVTDFGLARSLTEHMPWTAEVEGTAPFMAPEQASRSLGSDRYTH